MAEMAALDPINKCCSYFAIIVGIDRHFCYCCYYYSNSQIITSEYQNYEDYPFTIIVVVAAINITSAFSPFAIFTEQSFEYSSTTTALQ